MHDYLETIVPRRKCLITPDLENDQAHFKLTVHTINIKIHTLIVYYANTIEFMYTYLLSYSYEYYY